MEISRERLLQLEHERGNRIARTVCSLTPEQLTEIARIAGQVRKPDMHCTLLLAVGATVGEFCTIRLLMQP